MNNIILLAALIPAFPLCAYVIQSFFGKRLPRMGDWVSTGAIGLSFLCAVKIFITMWSSLDPAWAVQQSWVWMDLGESFKLEIGIKVDNIAAVMLLMVTLCATLIHLFSTGYMRDHHGKPEDGYRYASFFSFLSLFTAAMLGLIISDNLFTLFMCWELMGLCSYLLIGFYRHKISAANASIKAFMTTRVGDTFMFVGMLAIFSTIGSLQFDSIYAAISAGEFTGSLFGFGALTTIGFLIFCGTIGKSAQFPLQVWLPDAMEGPTPVSALIHAATMVAAGVYLIIRMFPVLMAGGVLILVAYVGAFTALFAAILAIKQNDIKKVLAYSTLSQLGYMVLAIGVGSYKASFMHLITHAVFKACLFMSSGAVIYAMHHEQNMNKMGGLRKKLPITFLCMLVTTLAISGVPFFSGFVSKDKILAYTYAFWTENPQHIFLVISGFLTAGLTAFYMFRLIFKTFFGQPADEEHYSHAHEVPVNMWIPLAVLAFFSLAVFYGGSITGGLVHHADYIFGAANDWFINLSNVANVSAYAYVSEEAVHHAHMPAMIMSIIVAALGIGFSFMVFVLKRPKPETMSKLFPSFVHRAIDNLYGFDWFYIKVVIQKAFLPFAAITSWFDNSVIDRVFVDGWAKVCQFFKWISGLFDDVVIDGVMVDGVGGKLPQSLGGALRRLQNGRVQRYMLVAISFLVFLLLFKGVL